MKNPAKLFLSFLALLFSFTTLLAQQSNEVEMASRDKIYVVLAVALIILIGLIIFLISIDRKVSRLEKKNQNNP